MIGEIITVLQIAIPVFTQPVPTPAPVIINDDQPTYYTQEAK